jgi:hypothetical protein
VDYILFDLKQGYCDYYATSMAVMLRSLGIPSRIVSGYAQGRLDPNRQAYVVLLQDAHTWVEVFFPNYGWVEFEPTAAQPAIVRPVEPEDFNPSDEVSDENSGLPPDFDRMDRMEDLLDEGIAPDGGSVSPSFWTRLSPTRPGSWFFGGLFLIILAGVTVWTMRNRQIAPLSNVGSIYHNMVRLAGWAGSSTHVAQTPYEYAEALGQVVPEGERPAQRIAGLYARERYGHKRLDDHEQASASQNWQELRPKLVRQTILRHIFRRGNR